MAGVRFEIVPFVPHASVYVLKSQIILYKSLGGTWNGTEQKFLS
ncbi:MAG: hypothetical protein EZS28_026005, partial [Streblomastix strix]